MLACEVGGLKNETSKNLTPLVLPWHQYHLIKFVSRSNTKLCKLQCHLHTQTREQKRSPAKSSRQKPRTRIPIQNASREFKSPAKGYERRWKKKKRNWITAREPTPCRATLAAARGRGGFRRRLRRAARDRCASGERGNGGGAAQVSRPRWEADAEGEQTEEQVVGGRSLSTTTGS